MRQPRERSLRSIRFDFLTIEHERTDRYQTGTPLKVTWYVHSRFFTRTTISPTLCIARIWAMTARDVLLHGDQADNTAITRAAFRSRGLAWHADDNTDILQRAGPLCTKETHFTAAARGSRNCDLAQIRQEKRNTR